MKRITTILVCLLCTLMMFGEQHLMFRTLPIDGSLKTAVKEVKKWGFMGMKIKNVAAMVGTLDGEDVILTLIATPESNTLFSVSIIYEGIEQWEELLAQYHTINTSIAAQYGEPTKFINEWEAPYSLDNNPTEAFKEEKAMYGAIYTVKGGSISVHITYANGKLCTIVAYIDEQNAALYKAEGGSSDNLFDGNAEGDLIE